MKDNKVIVFGAIIVVVIGLSVLSSQKKSIDAPVVSTVSTSTVNIAPGVQAEVQGMESAKISIVSQSGIKAPALDHPISFPSFYTDKASVVMKSKIIELNESLKGNPTSYTNWNDLAIRFKMLEDYKYSEEIWVYLTKVAPNNSDAYLNLGELYSYFLRDNVKAEKNFLRAVSISPHWLQAYERIVDFYVTFLQDKAKARDFLTSSIDQYPEMKDSLQPLIASLKN